MAPPMSCPCCAPRHTSGNPLSCAIPTAVPASSISAAKPIVFIVSLLQFDRIQSERIADDTHRAQRHGSSRDDRGQQPTGQRKQHARRNRYAERIVAEREPEVLL